MMKKNASSLHRHNEQGAAGVVLNETLAAMNASLRIALVAFAVFALAACNKITDKPGDKQVEQVQDALVDGTWRIVLLIDDGVDETSDVDDYTLSFADGGEFTATHNSDASLNVTGTWNVSLDDNRTELFIVLPNPGQLDDLNDDWYYIDGNTTLMEFDDDDDDNDEDRLKLERF
jgi:hypothetical protein